MPLVVTLRFPHGRYHATPWGRQVNEGRPEWPPSPWRIARALLSAWHRHIGTEEDEAVLQGALRLFAAPVTFHVPRSGRGHARHYLPLATRSRGSTRDDTALAMDPFVTTRPQDPCVLVLDADPTPDQLALLSSLAGQVGYLGRAETLVDMTIDTRLPPEVGTQLDQLPDAAELPTTSDVEQMLVPSADVTLEQLRVTTAQLRGAGLRVPAGARTVLVPYDPAPSTPVTVRRSGRADRPTPDLVLLRLEGRPLPKLADAVVVAEQVRQAARNAGVRTVSFTGRRDDDHRIDHAHAYWLPLPDALGETRPGSDITSVAIWSPTGFAEEELRALVDVRALVWGEPGKGPFPLEYARQIIGDTVVASPGFLGSADTSGLELFTEASVWRSVTPVTTGRHRKPRQSYEGFLIDEVRRQLRHTGRPYDSDDVEVMVTPRAAAGFRSHRNPTVRSRTGGTHRRTHVWLRFREPIRGPLLLGSLSHFGLGTFAPQAERERPGEPPIPS
jgi:CRISPR-associated protein Csb2